MDPSIVFLIPIIFIVMFFLIVALALRYSSKSEERQHELEMEKAKIAVAQLGAGTSTKAGTETAMIRCNYCGKLMPETESSCPNCGARRVA